MLLQQKKTMLQLSGLQGFKLTYHDMISKYILQSLVNILDNH